MAEPFSVAVGALSLIGVMKEIKEIGSACATFFGDIKHAKGHLQDLKDEANMLYIVLKSIANDMEQISYLSPEESSPAMWYLTVALDDYKKAVVSVRASVDELEKRTPNEADPSVKARFRFVRAKERIERYRESIKSHIQLLGIQQHNFHEAVRRYNEQQNQIIRMEIHHAVHGHRRTQSYRTSHTLDAPEVPIDAAPEAVPVDVPTEFARPKTQISLRAERSASWVSKTFLGSALYSNVRVKSASHRVLGDTRVFMDDQDSEAFSLLRVIPAP
ncbi:hypothetical protein MMC10_009781 [Thelotrema lepadinum]|nr:hypothetical protein [Thelotrema lepadinum]